MNRMMARRTLNRMDLKRRKLAGLGLGEGSSSRNIGSGGILGNKNFNTTMLLRRNSNSNQDIKDT